MKPGIKPPPLVFDGGNVCMICQCICTPENPKVHPAIPLCKACMENPVNLADIGKKETQARLFIALGLSIFSRPRRASGVIRRRRHRPRNPNP